MEKPRRRPVSSALVLLSAAVLCVGAALAQTGTTLVTGSLSDAMGIMSTNKLTATCPIWATATFTAATGAVVPANNRHVVRVTDGLFSAALLPVDGTDAILHRAVWGMSCHVPLQTADGRSCEGNRSLISQGLCVVGATDWGPVYLLVPTSGSAVDLKDVYRTKKPTGSTWGELLQSGTTWGVLLNGR